MSVTPIITWEMGEATPRDIIWTTLGLPLIVHERVMDLFAAHHLTGWAIYPVEVRSKTGEVVPHYHGLTIKGRCAHIDPSKSEVVLREYPGGWFPVFRGRYFSPDTWDGSDFFMEAPDERGNRTLSRFATERVWRLLSAAKVRNLKFERLTEDCVDVVVYQVGGEYLLPPDLGERVEEAYQKAGVPQPSR